MARFHRTLAALLFVLTATGAPRLAGTCTVALSGVVDDTIEPPRPVIRPGVEAPTLAGALIRTPPGDSGGCGGESTCEDVRFLQVELVVDDFTRIVEVRPPDEPKVYHDPTQAAGNVRTYGPFPAIECDDQTLELAAVYTDSTPAQRSPPLRIRCSQVAGAACGPCS